MKLKFDNLLGKPWDGNEEDCFSLGRGFFKQNFNIDIPNMARPQAWDAGLHVFSLSSWRGIIKHLCRPFRTQGAPAGACIMIRLSFKGASKHAAIRLSCSETHASCRAGLC